MSAFCGLIICPLVFVDGRASGGAAGRGVEREIGGCLKKAQLAGQAIRAVHRPSVIRMQI